MPSAKRLTSPKITTTLEDKEAPVDPATIAKVVIIPSLAAKTESLKILAFSWIDGLFATSVYFSTSLI